MRVSGQRTGEGRLAGRRRPFRAHPEARTSARTLAGTSTSRRHVLLDAPGDGDTAADGVVGTFAHVRPPTDFRGDPDFPVTGRHGRDAEDAFIEPFDAGTVGVYSLL